MTSPGLPESPRPLTYERWEPGTVIELCRVPWDNTYRDIVDFGSRDVLNEYLGQDIERIVYNRSVYAKPNNPVLIDLPFNAASTYNYVHVFNPAFPDERDAPAHYYYFINSVNYVAPNTTQLNVQLDVWQTYRWNIRLGRGFVERGHLTVAATAYEPKLMERIHLLTEPEGLEHGADYVSVSAHAKRLGKGDGGLGYVIYSTVNLSADPGSVDSPALRVGRGAAVNGLHSGAEIYYTEDLSSFLGKFENAPWITQGILGIYPIPKFPAGSVTRYTSGSDNGHYQTVISYDSKYELNLYNQPLTEFKVGLPKRYRRLTKFFTSPYMQIEVTMHNGTPIYVSLDRLKTQVNPDGQPQLKLNVYTSIHGPTPRIMYHIEGSGTSLIDGNNNTVLNHRNDAVPIWGDFLGNAGGVINIPSVPILNNSYIAFMAANANTLAYQRDSASWSQQRALMGAQLSRNQASAGIALSNSLAESAIMTGNQSTALANAAGANRAALGAISGVTSGVVGGAMGGGPVGALTGLVGSGIGAIAGLAGEAINQDQRTQQNAINARSISRNSALTSSNAAYMRDTNYELSVQFANGDYANAIAGINAKVNDAKLTPPTVSGQIGGDAFLLTIMRGGYHIFHSIKRIPDGFVRNIGEFWLRYGYASNVWCRDIEANLMPMQNFTYWKCSEIVLSKADLPSQFKDTIRGIFEKGVTVWKDPDKLATLSDFADNPVRGSGNAYASISGANVYDKE